MISSSSNDAQSQSIAIIGRGYVGLPLAVAFARTRTVIGFDANADRIVSLQVGHDSTSETNANEFLIVLGLANLS